MRKRVLDGYLSPDPYSTAWVALVPHRDDPNRPAWPESLEYLRATQFDDGGWGEPSVLYAHERTLATLAAIRALAEWENNHGDGARIERGLSALRRYAALLPEEPNVTIGFELLLPRLWVDVSPELQVRLPMDQWDYIEQMHRDKLSLIARLHPEPGQIASWWFSMEALAEEQLARLDDATLEANGSVATATAATAAYLRARRRAGGDSPRASAFLSHLLTEGEGSVPFCFPVEMFERVWVLDNLRRAGADPRSFAMHAVLESLDESWHTGSRGLSSSDFFPVNDGDDIALGFTLLCWGGFSPADTPLIDLWQDDHFRSYPDERDPSISVNIHALTALREQPGFPHRKKARRLSKWLVDRMNEETVFHDKWHFSPYYSVAHAISAFIGWDDTAARRCVDYLLAEQKEDGGWGWRDNADLSTMEETAHAALGLAHAFNAGLITDRAPLERAAHYLDKDVIEPRRERLWIGKTLYRSDNIADAAIFAARTALAQMGIALDSRLLVAASRDDITLESFLTAAREIENVFPVMEKFRSARPRDRAVKGAKSNRSRN